MALIPKFKPSDFSKMVQTQIDKIDTAVLQRLQFIGETFVRNARSVDTYKDQTGNLRSSIGYVILKDGEQIYGAFPGDKATGKRKGNDVANELSNEHNRGYVLIVVAGMEYAASVESKNYDVLTSSSIQATTDLENAISALRSKIGKMK